MKKRAIVSAVALCMTTGLLIGISAVGSEDEELAAKTYIAPNDVTMEYASSIKIEVNEAEAETETMDEPMLAEAAVKYPEWQNTVVSIVNGSLRVREEGDIDSEIVGKMYPYAVATIIEPGEEWTKIESGSVTGYVANEFLLFGDEAGEYITENYKYCATVQTRSLNVRAEATTDSECLGSVTGGQELEVVSESEEWIEIQYGDDRTAFVSSEYVKVGWNYPEAITVEEEEAMNAAVAAAAQAAPAPAGTGSQVIPPVATSAEGLALGQEIANYACQFVGNPYVYGGTSLTNGTDCSGFTMSVYAQFGYSLPHASSAQMGCGTPVDLNDVQPGDIICYPGHVGMYIGGGQIVHAATESTGIRISSMYYTSPYGARRIVQ